MSGREYETAPLEYQGEPLLPLRPGAHPEMTEAAREALWPFSRGPLTISGTFSGEAYPGALEHLLDAMRRHPDYCEACEGFPCQGGHPPDA